MKGSALRFDIRRPRRRLDPYRRPRGPGRLGVVLLLVAGCTGGPSPEDVAFQYGRALYAGDAAALHRLASASDRRARDEATVRRQQPIPEGFAQQAVARLAHFITAVPLDTVRSEGRATVRVKFSLPDANAEPVRALLHDWDEERLRALAEPERARILRRLDELGGAGKLPAVEGEERIELVRERDGWKVSMRWTAGVPVRFATAADPGMPLEVSVAPSLLVLGRGERVRVTVRARNTGRTEVTTRVAHRVEPGRHADALALLQCPLLVPVRLAPGETREFVSEYLLLPDGAADVAALDVVYRFPAGVARSDAVNLQAPDSPAAGRQP